MNKKEIFPSKYLSAGDLPENGAVVTISTVFVERMPDGVEKPIASFVERTLPNGEKLKDMIINVTKWNTISRMYGDESDDWAGKKILVKPGEVKMKGDIVPCIDVSSRKPSDAKPATPSTRKTAVVTQSEADDVLDQGDVIDEGSPY